MSNFMNHFLEIHLVDKSYGDNQSDNFPQMLISTQTNSKNENINQIPRCGDLNHSNF